MRGKNILTPYDKLKGWFLLFSIMSVVPSFENKSSLEFKSVGYANILPMNLKVPWVAYAWSKSKLLWVQIWLIRLCKFVLVMLEVWSCFQKKLKGKFPSDMQCPTRAICHIWWKTLHICCLMFCWVLSNCVTLVRYFSCFLDHKHTSIHLLHSYTRN